MNKVFNDVYLNCRFACLCNVLNYFKISPIYLLANNYYYISFDNMEIENIYYYDNILLFKILGIETKQFNKIKSIKNFDLEQGEIAILKQCNEKNDKITKGNILLLNIKENFTTVIGRESAENFVYSVFDEKNDVIDDKYNLYLKHFAKIDKYPTVDVFKMDNSNEISNKYKYINANFIFYKLFDKFSHKIIKNPTNLEKIFLDNDNIDKKIEFINNLKKVKRAELYKVRKLNINKLLIELIEEQLKILDIIGYHIYKSSNKKQELATKLGQLELEINQCLFSMPVYKCFKDIKTSKNMLDSNNLVLIGDYNVCTLNKQNNSINGTLKKNNKKYFYKIQSIDDFYEELVGYYTICDNFPVSTIKAAYLYNNCGVIIYELEKSIKRNNGLLSDYLSIDNMRTDFKFLDIIVKNYNNFIYKESYPMEKFYKKRIEERLERYFQDDWIKKVVIIDNVHSFKSIDIFKAVKKYFLVSKVHKCVLSHGDLNTMNIGLKPIFMDFIVSGYNCIEAEVALFCVSILFTDLYFSPKYHKRSYHNHEIACNVIPDFYCEYNEDKKYIFIKSQPITTIKRKNLILKYLNSIDYNDSEVIYYIIMRLVTIFNIDNYDAKDKFYTLYLVHYFYEELNRKNKKLIEIIKEMDVHDNIL